MPCTKSVLKGSGKVFLFSRFHPGFIWDITSWRLLRFARNDDAFIAENGSSESSLKSF